MKVVNNLRKHWRGYLGITGVIAGLGAMRSEGVYNWLTKDLGFPAKVVVFDLLESSAYPEGYTKDDCEDVGPDCMAYTDGAGMLGTAEFAKSHGLLTMGEVDWTIDYGRDSEFGDNINVIKECDVLRVARPDGMRMDFFSRGCLFSPPFYTPYWILRAFFVGVTSGPDRIDTISMQPKVITAGGDIFPARLVIEKYSVSKQ